MRERAYRARCYPTKAQARKLAQLIGAKRFVWNWALARRKAAFEAGEKIGFPQLSKALTELRRTEGYEWLAALPREPLTQVLRDLETAYKNFFRGTAKFPRFKKKQYPGSVRFTLDQRRALVDREQGRVQVDGVGRLKFKVTEELEGRLRSVTLRRDSAGRFFVSFTADRVPMPQASQVPPNAVVGVDLGVSALATTSEGEKTWASRKLEIKQRRLRRYQRSQSRRLRAAMVKAGLDPNKPIPKGKGSLLKRSRRFERQRRQIGKLYAQIADARRDLLHQLTTSLVRRYALIAIEDLNVKGMMKGWKGLRKRVANACMGEFCRQLEYKAAWLGRIIEKVDPFFPSSQLCHHCKHRYKELKLSQRTWECPSCKAHHDRDYNAAMNILEEALRKLREQPASYREEPGKSRAGSANEPAPAGCGTKNCELIAPPAWQATRPQACLEQARGRDA